MSGYALQYEATVVKDTGVTMLFWPKFATGDVAFDRNAIVDPLATALFGEDSEEGEPAKYPPRSPKTREAMMTLLKWRKDYCCLFQNHVLTIRFSERLIRPNALPDCRITIMLNSCRMFLSFLRWS